MTAAQDKGIQYGLEKGKLKAIIADIERTPPYLIALINTIESLLQALLTLLINEVLKF